MSIQEYIEADLPFYHLTKMNSLDSILENGLLRSREPGCRFGICVVRSMEDDIISEIIDRQLQQTDSDMFALIRILPREKNIIADDVSEDPIDEEISPMCNYICREPIYIEDSDIVRRDIPVGLWSITETEIIQLTGYQCPVPPIN